MCQGGFEPHRVEKKIKRNCPEEEEFKEEFGMAGSDSWHDYIDIADLFNTDGLFERNSESEKVTKYVFFHIWTTIWLIKSRCDFLKCRVIFSVIV